MLTIINDFCRKSICSSYTTTTTIRPEPCLKTEAKIMHYTSGRYFAVSALLVLLFLPKLPRIAYSDGVGEYLLR